MSNSNLEKGYGAIDSGATATEDGAGFQGVAPRAPKRRSRFKRFGVVAGMTSARRRHISRGQRAS